MTTKLITISRAETEIRRLQQYITHYGGGISG
jgi:hypothetical protein